MPEVLYFCSQCKTCIETQKKTELNFYSSRNLEQLSLSCNTLSSLTAHAIFKIGHAKVYVTSKGKTVRL